jgi:heme A synthase
LALGAAGLAFLVAVLGSWVRINDAGLTCPDWPLCRGSVVPALSGGVVLEWSHRAGVLLEAFLVIGVLFTGRRLRATVPHLGSGLAVLAGVFAVQVLLGGATVELGNSPISVVLHWAMAMALLATLTVLAVLGFNAQPAQGAARHGAPGSDGAALALVIAAGAALMAMCVGAYVSSSHAGLACASFPLCGPDAFGRGEAQVAQMLHRAAALVVVATALVAAVVVTLAGASSRVRLTTYAGCALVLGQAALGAANVYAAMPIVLRELHAGNAALTFIAFVLAATYANLERAPQRASAAQPSLRPAHIASSR